MQTWGVVIVLYHPDLAQVKKSVTTIAKSTSQMALVNNASEPIGAIAGVRIHELGHNRGIAYAQNAGVQVLLHNNPALKYVFFLDQDSAVPDNFFESMLSQWRDGAKRFPRLAALSPRIKRRSESGNYSTLRFDQKVLSKQNIDFEKHPIVNNTLPISSGLMVSVEAFQRVGGLSEKWFIDWVDFDFDLKLLNANYTIVTVGSPTIVHEIGTPVRRSFFGKRIAVTNYVLFREYYTARNGVYLIRKYGKNGKGIGKYVWGQIARRFLMLLYEPMKVRRFGTLVRGIFAGMLTPYD